jgi:hypothetical protein
MTDKQGKCHVYRDKICMSAKSDILMGRTDSTEILCSNLHGCQFKNGFKAGRKSRDAEVERLEKGQSLLKEEISALREEIRQINKERLKFHDMLKNG